MCPTASDTSDRLILCCDVLRRFREPSLHLKPHSWTFEDSSWHEENLLRRTLIVYGLFSILKLTVMSVLLLRGGLNHADRRRSAAIASIEHDGLLRQITRRAPSPISSELVAVPALCPACYGGRYLWNCRYPYRLGVPNVSRAAIYEGGVL